MQDASADIVVFDIPLLFETGGEVAMDAVVSASRSLLMKQKRRVMARGPMTEAQFEQIPRQADAKRRKMRAVGLCN